MQREMILGTCMASMSLLQLSKRLADLLERFIISTVIWLQDIIDLPCILSALSECCRFALPGTEKKTPTQVTSAMKSHAEQSWSAIVEPTTAVLLHLKSKADNNSAPASYANSSAPSDHTKSTQPSHAKSTGPPDKSAQVHVKPPVAKCTKTPEPIDQQDHIGSPASVATHDPGFNDLHAASSPAPSKAGDQETWEIDNTLLP